MSEFWCGNCGAHLTRETEDAHRCAATVPTSPTDTGDNGLRAALTALLDDPSPPRFDKDGNYLGLVSGNSDAHRTVGKHRAWSDTSEWCYPEAPCRACSEPVDQADLRAVLADHPAPQTVVTDAEDDHA